ncbi:MAG: PAS domain-containing protein [Bacteroidales bacterium]|nr:PAS domain-containing protein [Bacteroidales bacterium]
MNSGKKKVERVKRFSNLIKENTKLLDLLLKSILDSSEQLLVVIADNMVVFANRKAIIRFGFTSKELSTKTIDELFTTNQQTPLRSFLAIAVTIRKPPSEQLLVKIGSKSGSDTWYAPRIKRCVWKGKSSLLMMLADIDKAEEKTELFPKGDEARLQLALKGAEQGVWEFNFRTGETYISDDSFAILGYKPNEFKTSYEKWLSLIHPDFISSFENLESNIKKGNHSNFQREYLALSKKGTYVWLWCIGRVVEWDKMGVPVRMVGVNMNIDEKKRVEVEKDENRKTLEGLISNTHDGLVIIDQNGVIKEWNPAQEKITLIKRNQAIGYYLWDVQGQLTLGAHGLHSYLKTFKDVFDKIAHTGTNPLEGKTLETQLTLYNGERKIIQNTIFSIETSTGKKIAITVKDITESQTSRIKLEKSDERLKLALNAGRVGIWDTDIETGEKYYSPMAFQLLGYRPWEIEPNEDVLINMIHPDDKETMVSKVGAFQKTGDSLDLVFRIRKKDGSYIWIHSKNKAIRNTVGKILRLTGTISDITFQKNVEMEHILHREELLRNLALNELLSEISYTLNTNEFFTIKINEVLTKLGFFTNVSRIYILENSPDQKTTSNTFEWCNEEIESQIENLQKVPLDMILEWIEGKEVYFSNDLLRDMPSDLSEMMIAQGSKSCLMFPIQVEYNLIGFLGFDEYSTPKEWDKMEIELLKTIANLISFSYERERAHVQLVRNEHRFRELTDMLPHIIFEITLTGRLEFLNQTGCNYFNITKEAVLKGVMIQTLFPETESFLMSVLRNRLVRKEFMDPVRIEVNPSNKNRKVLHIWATPKYVDSRLVGFSGIALLDGMEV